MNNWKSIAATAMTCLLLVSSCGSGEKDNEISLIPCKVERNENWGFVRPDGTIVWEDEFKNTPSIVVNGVFTVWENNGFSVYSAEGDKPKVIGNLDNLKDAGYMTEGLIPVAREGARITYCDSKGKDAFILDPVKGHEIVHVTSCFNNGRAIVQFDDNSCGVIDTKGQVLVQPGKFEQISIFSEGIAVATERKKGDNILTLIDRTGKTLATAKGYSPSGVFHDGYVAVTKDGKCAMLDKKGEVHKLPSKAIYISEWNDKTVIFLDNEYNWGAMTFDGESIIRAKYRFLTRLDNGKYLGQTDNGKYCIINKNDEREKSFDDVSDIIPFGPNAKSNGYYSKFHLIIDGSDGAYLLDGDGERINKTEYYDIQVNENPFVSSYYRR